MNDLIEVTHEEIERFLDNNMKKMNYPEYLYAVDNNQDSIQKWDTSKLKILVVLLLPGSHKTVSNSFNCLNWLCHEKHGEDIFVDNCYFIEEGNEKVYEENRIPYLFGNCSHRPVKDYDLVLISMALIPEMFHIPIILKKSGIPYTVEGRASDLRIPPIIMGGASATEAPILYGHVYDEEGKDLGSSLVDMTIHGYGEVILPTLIESAYNYKVKEGKNLHDTNGFMEYLISRNILNHYIFYPNKYKWDYAEDKYTIKSIKPLDERLPERVQVNKLELEEWEGFPLKTFHLAGSNCSSIDVQVSSGCSGASTLCSFSVPAGTKIPTGRGLENIESLLDVGAVPTTRFLREDEKQYTTVKRASKQPLMEITLSDGSKFTCSENHRMMRMILSEGREEEVLAKDVKLRDVFYIKLGLESYGKYIPSEKELKERYEEDFKNKRVSDHVFYYAKESIEKYLEYVENDLTKITEYKFKSDIQLLYRMVGKFVEITGEYIHLCLYKDNKAFVSYQGNIISIETLKKYSYSSLPRIFKALASGYYFPVYVMSVKKLGREEVTYTTETLPNHRTCYNMLYTHNCHEATIAGNYHERTLENVEKTLEYARKTSAANKVTFYSYNLNYYYRFMDMIKKGAEYFSKISLINERLDVIAHAPEQLLIAKKLGLSRVSAPIEGFSNRLRNQFLNKNLSRETIMQAARNIYRLKIMHLKMGYIQTGYETKEDIDECISEVDEMFAIRDKIGAKTSLQMNITPLLYYTNIALRYLDRKTARMSFYPGNQFLYLIEEMKKRKVRVRIHSIFGGTWIEQLLIDFGPAGTDCLVKMSEQGAVYYSRIRRNCQEIVVKVLKEHGIEDMFFFCNARPKDWIFPNDYMQAVTDRVKKMWWERTQKMDFSANLCLKTLANEDATCLGCQTCDAKHIKYMTTRKIYDESTYDDVINSFSEGRKATILRFIVKQNPKWFFYNRDALQYYVTSQFFKTVPGLADKYFAVEGNSCQLLSANDQRGWYLGSWLFDVSFKEKVSAQDLLRHLEEVNSKLESCQVISIYDDADALKQSRENEITYLGVINDYSVDFFKNKMANTDWNIKVAGKSLNTLMTFTTKYMPELRDKILAIPYKAGALVYMSLPAYISPYLVMSTITKRSYRQCLQDCIFQMVDQTMKVDANCKCGNSLTFSLFKHDYNKMCPTCTGRLLLYNLSKKTV